jgi:hypothetical protein
MEVEGAYNLHWPQNSMVSKEYVPYQHRPRYTEVGTITKSKIWPSRHPHDHDVRLHRKSRGCHPKRQSPPLPLADVAASRSPSLDQLLINALSRSYSYRQSPLSCRKPLRAHTVDPMAQGTMPWRHSPPFQLHGHVRNLSSSTRILVELTKTKHTSIHIINS